jgi:hypothetical protein
MRNIAIRAARDLDYCELIVWDTCSSFIERLHCPSVQGCNDEWQESPDIIHSVASGLVSADAMVRKYKKVPLNFGDLSNPVPASAYFDARDDCWGKQSHCGTITDDSYRPNIYLDVEAWRSLMANDIDHCFIDGLYDPPQQWNI